MSQYTYIVHRKLVDSIEQLNDIITNGDEKYPGLTSAETIINIQVALTSAGYLVFWRERKWLSSDAAAAEHQ